MSPLLALILIFGELSLLAFGGASAILPAMQRALVDQHHWLTAPEFVHLFALAQMAPGPNLLAVTVFGWHIAGLWGAVGATLAFVLPASCLAFWVGRIWEIHQHRRWRRVIQAGLLPVTAGLMLATGWLLARDAVIDGFALFLLLATTAGTLLTRHHPLWFLLAAAGLGLAGFY